jgi:hypothetical protein
MGVRKRLSLALVAVVGYLLVGSFASPASAEAACTVTPHYPLTSWRGGGIWYVRGYAYVSGCTSRSYHVEVGVGEEIQPGSWRYTAIQHYWGPETTNHASWALAVNCSGYGGTGRFATMWRINDGARHRGSKVHDIC